NINLPRIRDIWQFLAASGLQPILKALESDTDVEIRAKALRCVSGVIRQNSNGFKAFYNEGGFRILSDILRHASTAAETTTPSKSSTQSISPLAKRTIFLLYNLLATGSDAEGAGAVGEEKKIAKITALAAQKEEIGDAIVKIIEGIVGVVGKDSDGGGVPEGDRDLVEQILSIIVALATLFPASITQAAKTKLLSDILPMLGSKGKDGDAAVDKQCRQQYLETWTAKMLTAIHPNAFGSRDAAAGGDDVIVLECNVKLETEGGIKKKKFDGVRVCASFPTDFPGTVLLDVSTTTSKPKSKTKLKQKFDFAGRFGTVQGGPKSDTCFGVKLLGTGKISFEKGVSGMGLSKLYQAFRRNSGPKSQSTTVPSTSIKQPPHTDPVRRNHSPPQPTQPSSATSDRNRHHSLFGETDGSDKGSRTNGFEGENAPAGSGFFPQNSLFKNKAKKSQQEPESSGSDQQQQRTLGKENVQKNEKSVSIWVNMQDELVASPLVIARKDSSPSTVDLWNDDIVSSPETERQPPPKATPSQRLSKSSPWQAGPIRSDPSKFYGSRWKPFSPPSSSSGFRSGPSFRSSSGTTSSMQSNLNGFKNLGQTCYIGSILQLLFNLTAFKSDLLRAAKHLNNGKGGKSRAIEGGKNDDDENSLFRELASLFEAKDTKNVVSPAALKECIGKTSARFAGLDQQDAHEFFTELLERLHGEVVRMSTTSACPSPSTLANTGENGSAHNEMDMDGEDIYSNASTTGAPSSSSLSTSSSFNSNFNAPPSPHTTPSSPAHPVTDTPPTTTSIIDQNFGWQIRHTLRCDACGRTSERCDAYRYISVDLPEVGEGGSGSTTWTLDELLDKFFKDEQLTYTCEICGHSHATASHAIETLPRTFVVHLKRFALVMAEDTTGKGAVNCYYRKRADAVEVPLRIDLSKRTVPGLAKRKSSAITPQSSISTEVDDEDDHVNEVHEDGVDESMKDGVGGDSVSASTEGKDTGTGHARYTIRSIVNHVGSKHTHGHYICDVYDPATRRWKSFNDSVVTTDLEENLPERRTRTAYILAFERG
ncbi:Ubiquitin carboxyl-terminal hydrolase 37, partial [Quaeritorhiza haematococci]